MTETITNNIKTIVPDEGYFLTDWTDGDIMTFSYAEKVVMHVTGDTSNYYEITHDRKNELESEQLSEMRKLGLIGDEYR